MWWMVTTNNMCLGVCSFLNVLNINTQHLPKTKFLNPKELSKPLVEICYHVIYNEPDLTTPSPGCYVVDKQKPNYCKSSNKH